MAKRPGQIASDKLRYQALTTDMAFCRYLEANNLHSLSGAARHLGLTTAHLRSALLNLGMDWHQILEHLEKRNPTTTDPTQTLTASAPAQPVHQALGSEVELKAFCVEHGIRTIEALAEHLQVPERTVRHALRLHRVQWQQVKKAISAALGPSFGLPLALAYALQQGDQGLADYMAGQDIHTRGGLAQHLQLSVYEVDQVLTHHRITLSLVLELIHEQQGHLRPARYFDTRTELQIITDILRIRATSIADFAIGMQFQPSDTSRALYCRNLDFDALLLRAARLEPKRMVLTLARLGTDDEVLALLSDHSIELLTREAQDHYAANWRTSLGRLIGKPRFALIRQHHPI
ncbi:hypothetical protein [Ferrimonas marina]|uniref:Uncharacterized protein n=1 Tax=Ferrimonas marina TaxID=299255 RepID=A0A1M5U6A2_9GAMM|nr:hypothetical protein [Ferrimonas marina]SHH58479.1 hypothetical protein SAMN02745129_2425 [Ferrimonas marina]